MRAQATEKKIRRAGHSLRAAGRRNCAYAIVRRERVESRLAKSQDLQTEKTKIRATNMELLFQCHCVPMEGELPATYFRRLHVRRFCAKRQSCARLVCGSLLTLRANPAPTRLWRSATGVLMQRTLAPRVSIALSRLFDVTFDKEFLTELCNVKAAPPARPERDFIPRRVGRKLLTAIMRRDRCSLQKDDS